MKALQLLFMLLLAGAVHAQAPPATQGKPAPVRPAADERINLTFRATAIEEVFDMLSRKDNINIILTRGVTGTVSVNLYNVTVREAIYRVAQASGYWVEERAGDYIILAKETSLDYPGTHTQIKTYKVQYSDVKQVADIVSKYVSRQGKVTPLIGRKLIVVEDLPGFAERIAKLLEEIDVQPRQVLIEAKILEVTLDDTERFGINWRQVFGGTATPAEASAPPALRRVLRRRRLRGSSSARSSTTGWRPSSPRSRPAAGCARSPRRSCWRWRTRRRRPSSATAPATA